MKKVVDFKMTKLLGCIFKFKHRIRMVPDHNYFIATHHLLYDSHTYPIDRMKGITIDLITDIFYE